MTPELCVLKAPCGAEVLSKQSVLIPVPLPGSRADQQSVLVPVPLPGSEADQQSVLIPVPLPGAVDGCDPAECWDYGEEFGPSTWPARYPLCGGSSQSPIDVIRSQVDGSEVGARRSIRLLPQLEASGKYELTMEVSSRFIRMKVPLESGLTATFEDVQYELRYVEFHRNSEHRLDGRILAFEIQLVFALPGSQAASLVLAVLHNNGQRHPEL